MKNQAEIYQVLLDGNTISQSPQIKAKLVDGILHTYCTIHKEWELANITFDNPGLWEIEQQWYDKDISNGVLCRVSSFLADISYIRLITRRKDNLFIDHKGEKWRIAEPLDLTKPLLPQLEDK
jgi:hypothetical protein